MRIPLSQRLQYVIKPPSGAQGGGAAASTFACHRDSDWCSGADAAYEPYISGMPRHVCMGRRSCAAGRAELLGYAGCRGGRCWELAQPPSADDAALSAMPLVLVPPKLSSLWPILLPDSVVRPGRHVCRQWLLGSLARQPRTGSTPLGRAAARCCSLGSHRAAKRAGMCAVGNRAASAAAAAAAKAEAAARGAAAATSAILLTWWLRAVRP